MTQRIVAVVGLSGVGKTSALNGLSAKHAFQHLSASRIIREKRALGALPMPVDTLRNANIDENQRLLIAGFKQAVHPSAECIVLDGHTIIETTSGLIPVGASVFGELGITEMIFFAANPAEIVQRRTLDLSRNRPPASVGQIASYQEQALLEAFRACGPLKIPLSVAIDPNGPTLEKLIFG